MTYPQGSRVKVRLYTGQEVRQESSPSKIYQLVRRFGLFLAA